MLDASHFLEAARRLSRLELAAARLEPRRARESVRAALQESAETDPDWLAPLIEYGWAKGYGRKTSSSFSGGVSWCDLMSFTALGVDPVLPPRDGPRAGTRPLKDGVETKQSTAVCEGQITLAAARNAIVTDWSTALPPTSADRRGEGWCPVIGRAFGTRLVPMAEAEQPRLDGGDQPGP